MMRHSHFRAKGTLLSAGFLFAIPLVTFAVFSGPLPLQNSIGLRAVVQVNNTPVKSPVTVSAGSDFSIVWESAGAGCVSNWSEGVLRATGVTTGSITASRVFVVTCFGPGVAQTVKLQVNVGTTDLSVSSFSVSGLSKKKKDFVAGKFTLKASIRNSGKLEVSVPVKIRFEEGRTGSDWISSGESTVPSIKGSASVTNILLDRTGNVGDTRIYRVCVDVERKVAETNEDNNCSKPLGPYTFVEPTF